MGLALMVVESRCTMTLGIRKIIVAGVVAAILLLANFFVLARWLDDIGLISWAQTVRDRYVTGTAITIIVVLLVLIVPQARIAIMGPRVRSRCRVCDAEIDRRGRYCPTCGSRL
jgi:formate-dependent nitrite reductase membrane component NrfD